MIPYGRQEISQQDIDAVISVLKSEYLTQGPAVPKFEALVANYCGALDAVAANSATSALHISCLALGLGEGDILWTSPITFVASANCALYCGAKVDFVDIDPRSYNMSVEQLKLKLVEAEKIGKLPKVVVPVHLCGQACEMAEIYKLSQKYGFKVIEDASHAIGGSYKGEPIGSCKYSDITIFSFHPVKIITAGEGGMALTNDVVLSEKMRLYRSHGISQNQGMMAERASDEIWNYQQVALGFNYRMTDIHAALGISQLSRIDSFVKKRRKLAQRYDSELKDLPLTLPCQLNDSSSSFHLYPIRINFHEVGLTQRTLYDAMRGSNILVNLHYIPVYRQPYYQSLGFTKGYCPEAEQYFKEALSIPLYPMLSSAEQTYIITQMSEIFYQCQ